MLQARKEINTTPQYQPPRRELKPSQDRASRSWGKKAVTFLIFLACFTMGIVVIAQYMQMVTLNYQISRAQVDLGVLVEEYRELEVEAARLGSLSRIEHVARFELGMREPDGSQLRVLTAVREDGAR